MATNRFLTLVDGLKVLVSGISAFTGNAEELVATDANGRISSDLLPAGVDVAIITATATEAIPAGAWVNYYESGGALSVQLADAADITKVCNGYAPAAIASGNTGAVSLQGVNTGVTVALTEVGNDFFLTTTPGVGSVTAPPIADNQINQNLGFVTAENQVRFDPTNYEIIDIA